MAWNGNFTVYDLPAGMEVKSRGMAIERLPLGGSAASGKGGGSQAVQEKKRRLTPEQIEFLENSFQEEAKLEPERKLMLARQLSLQPRQVAVWFQNRRARWKNKQLEHLYASLKHDFDAVSMEKQKLQDEVMKLKAELQERAMPRGSAGEKEDETLESMVMVRCTSSNCTSRPQGSSHHQVSDCNYLLNVDDCLHWGVFPGYM